MEQPQLIPINLNSQDLIYTPDWVAANMVDFFKPSGRILEPCKGKGVFMKYLPTAEWCEIQDGKDFFAWIEHVDWLIGNPPYSIFGKWLHHSMSIANDIAYLIPLAKVFSVEERMRLIYKWGGIKDVVIYGKGSDIGFPFGWPCGAVHIQKGYNEGTYFHFRERPSTNPDKPDDAHRIG